MQKKTLLNLFLALSFSIQKEEVTLKKEEVCRNVRWDLSFFAHEDFWF